jgi:hypothetical protein
LSGRRERVAPVVGLVERPVVAQAFGRQHQDAVVAQLVVLDDGERLEGLSQAHAVGQDAAAEALELVDRADDAVSLELVELLPDPRVADAGGALDDALLVQLVAQVLEQVVEDAEVDGRRRLLFGEPPDLIKKLLLGAGSSPTARQVASNH